MAVPLKRVYLDHNATTALRPEVRARFLEQLDRLGGNPSSVHSSGRAARAVLDEAREQTAAALAVHEDEIVFTGGGTEAIQIALLGAVRAAGPNACLVTTAVEHSAVLGAAAELAREGHPVHRMPVDGVGRVDIERLITEIGTSRAAVVSIQTANNEIGTVMPIAEIGRRLQDVGNLAPVFHTDAVQALGRLPLALERSNVDLAGFSAHKIGGPLGVGILYRRQGVTLLAPLQGGGQEGGLRPGTENVPAISAAALAVELATRDQAVAADRWRALSRSFWDQVQAVVPGVLLNGPPLDDSARLPNTLNLGFESVGGRELDGRMLVARADLEGLEVSAGSACASGSLEPSHVLLALGHTPERARAALRISFGAQTTHEDIHTAVEMLRRTFLSLR
ncbi:MAG: cysteine desulfurase family protein [Planctomycetota bacterium]|nr:cysteine desulfurase family protein [Planctomycetota bacterium]